MFMSPPQASSLAAHLAGVCRSTASTARRPAVLMLSEQAQDLVVLNHPCLSFPTDSHAEQYPVVALAVVPAAHGEPWGLMALTDAARRPANTSEWRLLQDAAEQAGALLDRVASTRHKAA